MGKNLHVFNPEHDLALAVGEGPYTPPAEIKKLKNEWSLLPARYASNGDFILLPEYSDDFSFSGKPFSLQAKEKNIVPVSPQILKSHLFEISKIIPWGWDHALVGLLKNSGISETLLPDENKIRKIRELSHRRTTIQFRKEFSRLRGEEVLFQPKEIFEVKEIDKLLESYAALFFKAPWSSSGRGIVASEHISHKGLMEWAHGVIKKQGSVIAEPAWERIIDFATEWWIEKGNASFVGLSVFETSPRGKYHSNTIASQKELKRLIINRVPSFNEGIIEVQKIVLEALVAKDYEGPLGIDMLADNLGRINPCVEINLRMTMGFIETETGPEYLKNN